MALQSEIDNINHFIDDENTSENDDEDKKYRSDYCTDIRKVKDRERKSTKVESDVVNDISETYSVDKVAHSAWEQQAECKRYHLHGSSCSDKHKDHDNYTENKWYSGQEIDSPPFIGKHWERASRILRIVEREEILNDENLAIRLYLIYGHLLKELVGSYK